MLFVAIFIAQALDTLRNVTIIKLYQAGFGKDILKSKITNSPAMFDVFLDGMMALKKQEFPKI